MLKRKLSQTDINQTNESDVAKQFKQGDLLFGMNGSTRNELLDELNKKGFKDIYSNKLNSPTVGLILNKKEDLSDLNTNQLKHYKFLLSHLGYLSKPKGTPVPAMKDNLVEGPAYRRACKLLVQNARATQRVHFDLTRMNITRVCRKEKNDTGVSNSELRAAFRQAKKDGHDNPHLFFYLNGKSCPAPWNQEQYKAAWEEYEAYRKKKKV